MFPIARYTRLMGVNLVFSLTKVTVFSLPQTLKLPLRYYDYVRFYISSFIKLSFLSDHYGGTQRHRRGKEWCTSTSVLKPITCNEVTCKLVMFQTA